MNIESYIGRIEKNILNNLGSKQNGIVFVKYYNTLTISEEDIVNIAKDYESVSVFFHAYQSNTMQSAYEPFLGWIKEIYDKNYSKTVSPENFVEAAGIYQLHRPVIAEYLKTGKCYRYEDVILSEVLYEQVKMEISIIELLVYISKKYPMFILLNKMHLAYDTTVRMLTTFMKKMDVIDTKNIGMMIIYNEVFHINEYVKPYWKEMIEKAESKYMIVDCGAIDENQVSEIIQQFVPSSDEVETYVNDITNMFYLCAFRQASIYLDLIFQKIERENFPISNENAYLIMSLYAKCMLYEGQIAATLMLCESIMKRFPKDMNKIYDVYYITAYAHMYNIQDKLAMEYSKKCLDIAKQIGDTEMINKSELLIYISAYCGWKDIFFNTSEVCVPRHIYLKLKEMKFYNTLSYFYLYANVYDKFNMATCASSKTFTGLIKKALDISHMIDNKYFLAIIYNVAVLTYANEGYHGFVERILETRTNFINANADELKKCLKEEYSYNGLGYNCIIMEEHKRANDYFVESLKIVIDLKDSLKIAETLYNMAVNGIVARTFYSSKTYLEIVFKILDILNVQSIVSCNVSKLYGLIAICYYYLKDYSEVVLYSYKMERYLNKQIISTSEKDYAYWDDDLFLCFFIKGVIEKKNHKYDKAEAAFDRAFYHMNRTMGFMFFAYPLYAEEVFDLYCKLGDRVTAEEKVNGAIDFCVKNDYNHKVSFLKSVLKGKSETFKFDLDYELSREMSIKIIDIAKKEASQRNLTEKKNELDFLSRWQGLLNNEGQDIDIIIKNAITTIRNSYALDEILLLKNINGKMKVLYKDETVSCNKKDIEVITDYFKVNNVNLSVENRDVEFKKYSELMRGFDKDNIAVLGGFPLFNENELEFVFLGTIHTSRYYKCTLNIFSGTKHSIMRFLIIQLSNTVDKVNRRKQIENINKRLNELVVMDNLTGLYNRKGLQQFTEKLDLSREENLYIFYMDLDDFKKYNDRYGHDVGDAVLVVFSNIVKDIISDKGITVRYGGDEFLALVYLDDINQATQMAENIYQEIKETFAEKMRERLGARNISDELVVGCTIGIAECKDVDSEGLTDALRYADSALRVAKVNKKGQLNIYQLNN